MRKIHVTETILKAFGIIDKFTLIEHRVRYFHKHQLPKYQQ